jgi:hypothetical protein
MIWESYYWKNDLLKRVTTIQKWMRQKRWSEASHARFEQALMLGFYSIRKLIEAHKLSNASADQQITVTAYPSLGKPVTFRNWHKLDQLYDIEAGKTVNRDLKFLCNQFVHSYLFFPVFGEDNRLCRVIVASEFERNRFTYEIGLDQVITLFEQIGSDYPNHATYHFDPKKRDYEVWQTMRVDPIVDEDLPEILTRNRQKSRKKTT